MRSHAKYWYTYPTPHKHLMNLLKAGKYHLDEEAFILCCSLGLAHLQHSFAAFQFLVSVFFFFLPLFLKWNPWAAKYHSCILHTSAVCFSSLACFLSMYFLTVFPLSICQRHLAWWHFLWWCFPWANSLRNSRAFCRKSHIQSQLIIFPLMKISNYSSLILTCFFLFWVMVI